MTLDEAVSAVQATLPSDRLRVDRRRVHADETSYLLLVLDTSRGVHEGDVANGPRLVDRATGAVTRITVTEALARQSSMALVSTPEP